MPIFRIPFIKRFVEMGMQDLFPERTIDMEIDGIGIEVHYWGNKPFIPGLVRKRILLEQEGNSFIKAKNKERAIFIFQSRKEAKIGRKSPVVRIDEKKEIVELPSCDLLRKEKSGTFTCKNPVDDENIFSLCVIQSGGYFHPKGCPIAPLLQSLAEADWM